ncbi:MAG: hypothetical protein B7733_19870 [Myxococcales bacterium FL481]|nr:MAG: hypothetical protein B7733_19870 [Myxococcales bacterium FL481]
MSAEFDEDSDIIEAVVGEGIEALEGAMAKLTLLESQPDDLSPLDELFRSFHSVKGNAAMVDMRELSEFAHKIEDVLSELLTMQTAVSRSQLQLIQEAIDLAIGLLDGSQVDADDTHWSDQRAEFLSRFAFHCSSGSGEGMTPAEGDVLSDLHPTSAAADDTAQAEREHATAAANNAPQTGPDKSATDKAGDESLRVKAKSLREIVALAGDLFLLAARLERLSVQASGAEGTAIGSELREISYSFDSATNDLYEKMLDVQRVEISKLTRPLERIVRDVCRAQDKWITFVVNGMDLRIDRRVIDQVRDSLVHMVRNSIDHGIETADRRREVGKPEQAKVELSIAETDDFVVFTLEDDGKGIDLAAVKRKAVARGLVSEAAAAAMPDDTAIEFIFSEGFSTAQQVTDLSGRGVGMNVVARAIREAGGSIRSHTVQGQGTRFELFMPKAGSPVVEGLVVRVGTVVFLVPMKGIYKFHDWSVVQVLKSIDSFDLAVIEERTYPLVHLHAHDNGQPSEARVGLILEDPRARRCVVPVAEVLGHTRALVARVEGDATLLRRETETFMRGDGGIGYVVNVEDFVAQALAGGPKPPITRTN